MNGFNRVVAGILIAVLVIGGLMAVGFVVQGYDFFVYRYFAPKYEQVRHDTFKQSQAYNDGVAQELQNMQTQYLQADAEHKKLLAAVIIRTVASYDESRLPSHLREFVDQIRQKQANPR